MHLHRATLDEILMVNGFPVAPTARTVLDLAREHGVLAGLAAADAALHDELITREQLEAVLALQEPLARRAQGAVRRGLRRRAHGVAAGIAEPAAACTNADCPPPDPQVLICDEHGTIVTRADFYWGDLGVVGRIRRRHEVGAIPRSATRATRRPGCSKSWA